MAPYSYGRYFYPDAGVVSNSPCTAIEAAGECRDEGGGIGARKKPPGRRAVQVPYIVMAPYSYGPYVVVARCIYGRQVGALFRCPM